MTRHRAAARMVPFAVFSMLALASPSAQAGADECVSARRMTIAGGVLIGVAGLGAATGIGFGLTGAAAGLGAALGGYDSDSSHGPMDLAVAIALPATVILVIGSGLLGIGQANKKDCAPPRRAAFAPRRQIVNFALRF